MNCEDLAAKLTEFMEGELSAEDEVAALEHVASCTSCETVLSQTRDVVELAKDHGRAVLNDDDRDRLLSAVLRDLPTPDTI